jgi:TATA-box binding protein (TBP) (component of TFIID and TFIIIB)
MKNKQDKRIKNIANKIANLEKEILLGKSVQENQQKIENIVSTLSLEDMLEIDEYILKKKLLTR